MHDYRMTSNRARAVAALAAAGVAWGISVPLSQIALTWLAPGWLTAARFGVADVRDVADLHLRAMTQPAAKGERFLAVAGENMSMKEMAELLRARMGEAAKRVPTRAIPDWVVRLSSLFDSALKQVVGELGTVKNATNEKARRLLGWQPRSNEGSLLATAESLVSLGLLRKG